MDAIAYRQIAEAEGTHWWDKGRWRVVDGLVSALKIPKPAQILDAGCGFGGTMENLASLGEVTGVEPDGDAVELAHERGIGRVLKGTLEQLPLDDDDFDLITCLDVIEHVEDDRQGFTELRRVVRTGGHLVVTVPAYQWLWSHHDVVNNHYRRYTRRNLLTIAEQCGWKEEYSGYFNTLLFAPAAIVRLGQRIRRQPPERGLDSELTPPSLNRILEAPFRMEAWLIQQGLRLPVGLSVCSVFKPA